MHLLLLNLLIALVLLMFFGAIFTLSPQIPVPTSHHNDDNNISFRIYVPVETKGCD
jgi:hypothetical protein